MRLRTRATLLLALALVAASAPAPVRGQAAAARTSSTGTAEPREQDALAPVLIRWPLEAGSRRGVAPSGREPAARPADAGPPADARPEQVVAARPAAPSVPVTPAPAPQFGPDAPRRPGDVAPPGGSEPIGRRPALPGDHDPGPGITPRPGLPPAQPPPPGLPDPEPPAVVGGTIPGVRDKPSEASEDDHVLDFGLLVPEIAAPRVGAVVPPSGLTPPTPDVRRWTFANPPGVSWEAQEQSSEGDWIVLRGQVDVRAGLERIQADEVRWNTKTNELQADGNIVLDRLDSRLTGSRLEYDLDTNTGLVFDALGMTGDDLSFTADVAEKVGPDKFVLRGGSFTSCTQPLPIWQVKASKAVVHLDHFVYMWNPRVFFKKVPAHYLPWVAFPIKQDRTTGFMIPKASSSSRRGFSVQEDFFWAINRSADMTFGGQWWERFGWRGDLEGRWHLDGMTQPGFFEGVFIHANEKDPDQPKLDQDRYDFRWEHRQDLAAWDLTLTGEIGSDQLVDDEFGWDPTSTRSAYSPIFNQRVSLQRQWGKHSLNLYAQNDERETTTAQANTVPERVTVDGDRELPVVEYRASGLQVGGRRWLSLTMEGSVAALDTSQEAEFAFDDDLTGDHSEGGVTVNDHDYFRADFYPQLRMPMGTTWLQVIPEVAVRGTWWSRREAGTGMETVALPGAAPQTVTTTLGEDDGLFMWGWDAGLALEGPDFERIYRPGAAPGRLRWQHLIEPSIELSYAPKLDEEPVIAGDLRLGHYQQRFLKKENRARLRLVNTLRSKRVVPPGSTQESARDVLIWTLSTDYDFEEAARTATFGTAPDQRFEHAWFNNVLSDVNFKPTDDIHFSLSNTYDTLQDDVTNTRLTGGVDGDWGYVDVSFSSNRETARLASTDTELSLTGEHWFWKGDRIRLGYDFTRKLGGTQNENIDTPWLYRRFVVSYFNQCLGLSLSWEDQAHTGIPREQEWTFIVTMKDVGNYLRYRERSTE